MARTMMEDAQFWKIVDAAKWPEKRDYGFGKRILKLNLPTKVDAMMFYETYHSKTSALEKLINSIERETEECLGLGDDSFGDLIAHVVGSGQEVFERSLQNPKEVFERAAKGDFGESFAYCLPSQFYDYEDEGKSDHDRNRMRLRDTIAKQAGERLTAWLTSEIASAYVQCPEMHEAILRSALDRGYRAAVATIRTDEG